MTLNLFDETKKLDEQLKSIIENVACESVLYCGFSECSCVDILIVDLLNMHEINRDKRGIDAPTDVLSFPTGAGELFLGDIVIAYEKIFSQAEEYGHSPERELGFLTAHAMLHLMGFDHDTLENEARMFEAQEVILEKLGLRR